MLLPGRIVSLPLTGLGVAANRTLLVLERDNLLPGWSAMPGAKPPSRGIALKTPRLGDRAGLGLRVEAFTPLLAHRLETQARARYTGTVHGYNSTGFSITGSPAQLEYAYDWRPEERFYGMGMPATDLAKSGFASQTESVRGSLHFGWDKGEGDSLPRTSVVAWAGPRSAVVRTGREPGVPSIQTLFPDVAAGSLDRRVDHFVYGARIAADTRSGTPHWTSGWRTVLQAERYDDPVGALALHSGDARGARYTRYEFEGETGASFWHDPRTLRLFVRLMDQNVDARADRFLVSDLATLGGTPGLGGYAGGRFRDLDLLLARLTYIFPISRRIELDLHTDRGSVYHDVWADARFAGMKQTYGFAVRARDDEKPLGSLGLDFSREGARIRWLLGGAR